MTSQPASQRQRKPCTHCGQCCLTVTCALGQAFFLISDEAVCPAIQTDDKLFYCGLISNTERYVSHLVGGTEQWKIAILHDIFIQLVGIGIGCTNGEKTGETTELTKTVLEIAHEVAEQKELK